MPKKSSKSKSKRVCLKQKYKIIKKVKEHQKKKRKEDKKKSEGGASRRKAIAKDPGLPSAWPFKEDLVKEFAFKRAQILADEKRKKEERKAARQVRDTMDTDKPSVASEMAKLGAAAAGKQTDFETRKRARLVTDEFTSDKDNSRKAFYREFKKVVEAADVILQVLDARDPLACRAPDVERYIRSSHPNKKIILLMNKMDLVPREVGEKWLKHFRQELPTVAFKCSTQAQASNISQRRMPPAKAAAAARAAAYAATKKGADDGMKISACLGADTLLQLLKNYTRNAGIKTAITVGVVGLPNVGKSSVINSLKRARVAQVGNTPGVTKAVQEVHLDKNIKLLDSPGVVFAAADSEAASVLRNCIKVEKLSDPLGPVAEVLRRVPAKELMALYKIPAFTNADQFVQLIAAARGKLLRGGTPNVMAAAKIVLQDWNDGRIPYYTLPPSRATEFDSAAVVASYAKDFDADEVFAHEASAVIVHLPSLGEDDSEGVTGSNGEAAAGSSSRHFFAAESAGPVGVDFAAMEEDEKQFAAYVEGGGKRGAETRAARAAAGGEQEPNSSEDEGDDMDDGEGGDEAAVLAAAAALQRRREALASGQNGLLYKEAGQYNPHAARAEKKKKRKGSGGLPVPTEEKEGMEESEEFDFEAANGDDAGDVEDVSGSDVDEGSRSNDGEEGSDDGQEDGEDVMQG